MEETFDLTWEDSSHVVQTEEVICGMENEILPTEAGQFAGVSEGVTEEIVETPERPEQIMYLSDGNVLVMQESDQATYQDQLMDCQVTEEIITEQWGESCPEEIVIGSEEAIGDTVEAGQEEDDIKLPTDQDEYTAARPYPCDFCSRRFRKKGNLMNHMIAHQTDRPHGCNLCGVRYIRKSDLMNHLKIHAYIPDAEVIEEEDSPMEDLASQEKLKKKQKQLAKRKKREERIKFESYEDDVGASSSSRNFTYVEEEEVGDYEMPNDRGSVEYHHQEYIRNDDDEEEVVQEEEEIRYPVTDPRKPFVCQHCGVAFAREKAMLSHTRLHAEGDSPFECQKCGDMFWDPDQMRDHARNKHGETEDLEDDDDEDYSDEDSKYGTFYCATCGMSFHRQDNLRRHQRVHIKEEYLSEHSFGHVCNVCGESFPEALDLLAHAEVHARTIEYRCMICGDVMTDESALAVHVQAKHGKNLPPNSCMLCGRACKDRRTLLKHSWEHSKEKVFACSKCTKTFHNKARLKRHMLSHRSKAVPCDVCGEEFPDGRSLMNHRHSHSSVSGRQFPCRECGKTFGSRSSQQIHIRIHTGERPYGCRFCWKAFADGGTLRKHERIHTGEKPYACAVCPRAFNQRVVLREHIRSHHSGPDPKYSNSMTPYCCTVCSDMFATSQDLILHLIHHCDLNTAMKRQPQVRPRKYKRRRKLKPHELDLISSKIDDEDNDNNGINLLPYQGIGLEETYTESDDEREQRKRVGKRLSSKKVSTSPKERSSESLSDLFNNSTSVVENVNPMNPKVTPPAKNKQKKAKSDQSVPSRPKMIHTQKTRVPVESGEDGRVRHRTRTLVTRTHPTELKSAIGERIRPRTKNVNYHILHEKLPTATFPGSDQDTQRAVDSILKDEPRDQEVVEEEEEGEEVEEEIIGREEDQQVVEDGVSEQTSNGVTYADYAQQAPPPEVASEQTVETEDAVPVSMVHVAKTKSRGRPVRSTRHVIGPRSKVRMIKQGMIVSKVKKEPELILPDNPTESLREEMAPPSIKEELITIKQELLDPSPLHELAEISMQHAQNLFKCEMCSEVFSDRAQLLVHVPVHI